MSSLYYIFVIKYINILDIMANTAANKDDAMITDSFLQLVQVALGHRAELSRALLPEQWSKLLDMAVKQALVGICGIGIEQLPAVQRPPHDVAMRWAFLVSNIEQRNLWMNRKCGEVTELLERDGFSCCILKGQGVATLYPEPLRRQSGDIDVLCWARTTAAGSCSIDEVVDYVRSHSVETAKAVYHHADMRVAFERSAYGNVLYVPVRDGNDIEIEMHYRPSWFYSPLRNRSFQRWYMLHRDEMEKSPDGTFFMPAQKFNAVYILVHIYRHLFDEGIGLRQLLDYYYVLMRLRDSGEDATEVCAALRQFGLLRFCGAVMYVLREVFGMCEEYMPVAVNEREGRFLLSEIMLAGNFGQYDERSRPEADESLIARFLRRQRRVVRFLVHYPEETVCAPLWTVWHWVWRQYNGY